MLDFMLSATLKGYEVMAMIRKGLIQGIDRDRVSAQVAFIHDLFGLTT